jgi:phage terminase small subunit
MTRGRKPKTASQLKLHGACEQNPGRYEDRALAPQPTGAPERPSDLDGDAAWHWDFVIRQYAEMGVVTGVDTMELRAASEMWQLYRQTFALAKENPTDKDLRISVVQYKTAWETSAAKLGLNPTDRQRLKVEKNQPSEFDAFMEQHG